MILDRFWNSLSDNDKGVVGVAVAAAVATVAAVAVPVAALVAVAAAAAVAAADNKLKTLLFTLPFSFIVLSLFNFSYFFGSWSAWYILPLILLGLTELFFWIDKSKPNKNVNIFWYTVGKKFESLFDALIAYVGLISMKWIIEKITPNWSIILKWIGYIGAGILVLSLAVGIIYVYIKLNSLKYKNGGKKHG